MKNTRKRTSSLVCCLLCFFMTGVGQSREYYYLVTCKEKEYVHIFSALKYERENDGRVKVEEFKYHVKDDTMTLLREYFFRKSGLSLIRYVDRKDTIGQIYLKIQLDTSFVFKYDDPFMNECSGSTFRYLGKELLQNGGKKIASYKFREDKHDSVSSVYLDEDFFLERIESIVEKYFHYVMERKDPQEVPKGFREKVENYKSEMDIEKKEDEGTRIFESESGKEFWIYSLFVVCFIVVFYMYFFIRNRLRCLKKRNL